MKIVIDIPEEMYLNAKADTLCGADILVKAIKNGIPHETVTEFADHCRECGRERVLDKIRAEIEQMIAESEKAIRPFDGMEVVIYTKGFGDGIGSAIDVIDKYRN